MKMTSAEKPPAFCLICFPSTKQQRIIVKTMLKKLKSLLTNSSSLLPQILPSTQTEAFSHLTRAINLQSSHSDAECSPCRHLKWMRFLRDSHYTSQQLNTICQMVFQKYSERSYHLWLIETQVKNVANSIANASFLPLPKSRMTQTSLREDPPQSSDRQGENDGNTLNPGFAGGEGEGVSPGPSLVFFNPFEGRQGRHAEGVEFGELSNLGLYYTFPYFFESNL